MAELPARFVRCHQSFLVNLDYVVGISASSVVHFGGEELPMSRRWRTSMREALIAHVRDGL